LRSAIAAAGAVVLEPISRVAVWVPPDLQGAVFGDIVRRRGHVQTSDIDPEGHAVIHALIPSSELARYVIELRSLTAGRARFTAIYDHHDVVPTEIADRIPAVQR
jgi:elongation factor G